MKRFKKMMAIAVVAVMTLAYAIPMSFAAVGDLSVNGNLEVDGLDAGDTVAYYQILKWDTTANPTNGWTWGSGIKSGSTLDDTDLNTILGTTDGSGKINAELANRINENVDTTKALTGGTVTDSGETAKWTTTVTDAGLYMVIVTPKNGGTVYNPVFVAANWYGDGEIPDSSNKKLIIANKLDYSDTAMAKKTIIPLEKTATSTDGTPYTTDVGEEITFQVKTHVPYFGSEYTNPVFSLTDKLEGLALTGDNVKVYKYDSAATGNKGSELTGVFTKTGSAENSTTYTVAFNANYLKGKEIDNQKLPVAGLDIIIEYTAKVTDKATKIVNQDKNTVDLKFSTSPTDTNGAGLLRDQTNHFTFSIDADLLGHSEIGGSSNEAIKVGVDKEGNYVVQSKEYAWSNNTKHGPLAGATFKLYKDNNGVKSDELYSNTLYPSGVTVVSDADGRINIKGLDAGTYWLVEDSAPAGYIKMQSPVKVVITAKITENVSVKDENVNGTNVTVTYKTNKLDSYSVKFGDEATTSYTITNSESSALAVKADREVSSSDMELKNTKGVELPSTGGMGTTLFYIIGAILIIGAGVLLVTRRRTESVEE